MPIIETFIPDLAALEAVMLKLAAKIAAPSELLPTIGHTEDFARPHLEHTGEGFHFVVVERGHEQERRTTCDGDEILYWIFESVTFNMACQYELTHRAEGQDFRRMLFAKQEELLGELNSPWKERLTGKHRKILGSHPLSDESV